MPTVPQQPTCTAWPNTEIGRSISTMWYWHGITQQHVPLPHVCVATPDQGHDQAVQMQPVGCASGSTPSGPQQQQALSKTGRSGCGTSICYRSASSMLDACAGVPPNRLCALCTKSSFTPRYHDVITPGWHSAQGAPCAAGGGQCRPAYHPPHPACSRQRWQGQAQGLQGQGWGPSQG